MGSDICEAVFPEEGSGWDMEANALVKKDNEKDIAKEFLDWAISDNIMTKYATNYPIVAIGVGDEILRDILPIRWTSSFRTSTLTRQRQTERAS